MTDVLIHLAFAWGLAASLLLAMYLRQLQTKNATAVDLGWALSIGLAAALYATIGSGEDYRRLVLAMVVGTWSLRLSAHLFADRVMKPHEDTRYKALRELWGPAANRNFFFFYQAQALLAVVLSLPFALLCQDDAVEATIPEVIGGLLWLVGLTGEAIADRQLARFRANPANRGTTCRVGLWNWSRHPNYFFEWLVWVGFGVMPLASPMGYLGLIAPALMWFFIVKVTGIPPAELQALKSRGESYRRYQREVNAFIPGVPQAPAR